MDFPADNTSSLISVFKFSIFCPAPGFGSLAYVSEVVEIPDTMDKWEKRTRTDPLHPGADNDVFWKQVVQKAEIALYSLREECHRNYRGVQDLITGRLTSFARNQSSCNSLIAPYYFDVWTHDFFGKDVFDLIHLRQSLVMCLHGRQFHSGEKELLRAVADPINDFFRDGPEEENPVDFRQATLGSIQILQRPKSGSPTATNSSKSEVGHPEMFSMSPDPGAALLRVLTGPESSRSKPKAGSPSTPSPYRSAKPSVYQALTRPGPNYNTKPNRSSKSSSGPSFPRAGAIYHAKPAQAKRGYDTTPPTQSPNSSSGPALPRAGPIYNAKPNRPPNSSCGPALPRAGRKYNAKPVHPTRGYDTTRISTRRKGGPKKRAVHPSRHSDN